MPYIPHRDARASIAFIGSVEQTESRETQGGHKETLQLSGPRMEASWELQMKKQPRSFGVSLFACGRLHAKQKANDVPPRCPSRRRVSLIVMQEPRLPSLVL